jgi:DNA-binding GntR family transcriptional regulator
MNQIVKIPHIQTSASLTEQEATYQRLRTAIMTGAIAPETMLTFRGLSDALECSPTPVREAIRRLSTENAIEVLGNRRMRVPAMTPAKFEEIVNLRITLESHAGIRAMPYISEVLIDQVEQIDRELDAIMAGADSSRLTIRNHDFHRLIYTANPHQVVMPAIESIWLQLGPFQHQVTSQSLEYYVVDRHKEIIAALHARDGVALAVAIESDIRDGIYRSGMQFLQYRAQNPEG